MTSLPSPNTLPPTLITRLIKIMMLGFVLALSYVILKSCSTPKIGMQSYARGSLSRLVVLTAPPPLPEQSFAGPRGPVSLADFEGKVVLLNVWATWCAPCVVEMPSLNKLAGEHSPDRFAVVAVSHDREGTDAREFLDQLQLSNLAFYHDPSFGIARAVNAPGLPVSILYDRNGREIARIAGDADWASAEAKSLIEAALAQ